VEQFKYFGATVKGKGKKGRVQSRTGHEGPEGEERYSGTLSSTSALDGGTWSAPRPSGFTSTIRDPVPILQEAGRPLGWSGLLRKISPLTGIRSSDRPARSESVYRLRYPGLEQSKRILITLMKKSRLYRSQGMLAIIWYRIFCLSVCYPKI
jgi:hypothetical protein